MSIPFTQYLMPDGRKKEVTIDRPHVANRLISEGCVFEIEMLSTGEISMTCECDEDVLSHFVCLNGPDVPETVDRLVGAAAESKVRLCAD